MFRLASPSRNSVLQVLPADPQVDEQGFGVQLLAIEPIHLEQGAAEEEDAAPVVLVLADVAVVTFQARKKFRRSSSLAVPMTRSPSSPSEELVGEMSMPAFRSPDRIFKGRSPRCQAWTAG